MLADEGMVRCSLCSNLFPEVFDFLTGVFNECFDLLSYFITIDFRILGAV
jgi:hypothetical protein